MTRTLHIVLGHTLRLELSDHEARADLRREGLRYDVVNEASDTLLFYDWLEDDQSNVCGIELHICNSHPAWQALQEKSYVAFAPYPQIRFRNVGSLTARGIEAFGDIQLLRASGSNWIIAVELGDWLSGEDIAYIEDLIGAYQ